MNRRDVLKLGFSAVLATIASPFVLGQSNKVVPGSYQLPVNKLDDTVTYNAGWVVPVEDRAQLLELESQKNREQEESAKQKLAKPSGDTSPVKEKSKTISERYHEFIGKVRTFF